MSVQMHMRVAADVDAFRRFIETSGDVLEKLSEDAKSAGCLHHRYAVGDGYLLVDDEWESADAFMKFFGGNEAIAQVMRDAGAQGEPEISVGELVDAPGTF